MIPWPFAYQPFHVVEEPQLTGSLGSRSQTHSSAFPVKGSQLEAELKDRSLSPSLSRRYWLRWTSSQIQSTRKLHMFTAQW